MKRDRKSARRGRDCRRRDEDVFIVAEYVAVNYASHTCVYKVAPGYSYFLEG